MTRFNFTRSIVIITLLCFNFTAKAGATYGDIDHEVTRTIHHVRMLIGHPRTCSGALRDAATQTGRYLGQIGAAIRDGLTETVNDIWIFIRHGRLPGREEILPPIARALRPGIHITFGQRAQPIMDLYNSVRSYVNR